MVKERGTYMLSKKIIVDDSRRKEVCRDYMVECLREALKYCFEQYHDTCGEIDPLPTINQIGLSNEDTKYKMVEDFLKHI